MKKLIAAVLALLSFSAFSATMSEEEFTRYYVQRAEASLKDVHYSVVAPLQLKSKDVKGIELTTFLGNAYRQYTFNPDASQKIVDDHIATLRSQKASMAVKEPSAIFAVVKPADYLETAKRQLAQAGVKGGEFPLVYEKINDDLYAFYVYDTESGMRIITKKDMTDNKLELQAMRSIAVRNMSDYFQKKGVKFNFLKNTGAARIYTVSLDDNYEASILFLDKFWNKQSFDVQGDPVVFFPARNMVLVTGSGDSEGLRLAGFVAAKAYKEVGYAISPHAYVHQAGEWKRYAP